MLDLQPPKIIKHSNLGCLFYHADSCFVRVQVKECRSHQLLAEASIWMHSLRCPHCRVAQAKHKVGGELPPMRQLGTICSMHRLAEVQGAGKVQGLLLEAGLLPMEGAKAGALEPKAGMGPKADLGLQAGMALVGFILH